MSTPIHCILAVDLNNGIANTGGIPWNIKDDMSMFRKITTTCSEGTINAVIMGRETYESIGKVLKGRLNIVISSRSVTEYVDYLGSDYPLTFKSPELAINWLNKQTYHYVDNIFIIGGLRLYNEFINSNIINKLYITKIDADYKTTKIVDIDISKYNLCESYTLMVNDLNDPERGLVNVTFSTYENINYDHSKLNPEETQYLKLVHNIISTGNLRQTRNAKTYASFGKMLEFDLKKGFPLLTTKKMALRLIFEELKFFLLGKTNTKELEDKNVNIWKGNTNRNFLDENGHSDYKDGDMGPMYGFQLLHFNADYVGTEANYENVGYNQLSEVIHLLKTDKFSRRIVMTTYNPIQAKQGVLYPCHGLTIQFGVEGEHSNELSCHMYQLSSDAFLGKPYNIASYALLVHIICNIVNECAQYEDTLIPGRLIMSFGDVHVYEDHIEAVKEQITRKPYKFPWLQIKKEILGIDDIKNLEFSDIKLIGYKSSGIIKAPMIA
jgi:dihydrofolate reductase/thymidylate synthase